VHMPVIRTRISSESALESFPGVPSGGIWTEGGSGCCDWRISSRLQNLHHDGLSVNEIARCGPEYAAQVPEAGPPSEYEPKSWKVDQHRAYLREHWERGVRNPSRLFELQKPE
jgi:hypothetical protein